MLAQFYPKKYPANFWLLLGCVAAYVVLSTLMTGQPGCGWGLWCMQGAGRQPGARDDGPHGWAGLPAEGGG